MHPPYKLRRTKMSYVREPFENLDVMNFFMFNKLTTQTETAEPFSRCMIKNLLGIEVNKIKVQAEKIEIPDNPEKMIFQSFPICILSA